MTVYEYIDENNKVDENCLTVDFYFESNVTKDEAIIMIDDLVTKFDDNYLIGHKPTVFVKSPFSD
jgi:hypothetical protein